MSQNIESMRWAIVRRGLALGKLLFCSHGIHRPVAMAMGYAQCGGSERYHVFCRWCHLMFADNATEAEMLMMTERRGASRVGRRAAAQAKRASSSLAVPH